MKQKELIAARREFVTDLVRRGHPVRGQILMCIKSIFNAGGTDTICIDRKMALGLVRPSEASIRRKRILERDKSTCQYCGTTSSNPFILEHVVPQSKGGVTEDYNLVVACHSCNVRKGPRTWIPLNLVSITEGHPEWRLRILREACLVSQALRTRSAGQEWHLKPFKRKLKLVVANHA